MRRTVVTDTDDRRALDLLGKRVKLARLRRNMTQGQMAERAGVSRKTYQALEAGKETSSLTLLMRVIAVLRYPDRIPDFLASDPMGDDLEEVHGRRRASADRGYADF